MRKASVGTVSKFRARLIDDWGCLVRSNPKREGPPVDREWFPMPTEICTMNEGQLVAVVDDDQSVRESLPDLLRVFGLDVRTFASAEEFLSSDSVSRTSCLILDVTMPRMSGPELQIELAQRDEQIPIIFITAHQDDSERLRLMELGAVDCLFKPFSDTALYNALNCALGPK